MLKNYYENISKMFANDLFTYTPLKKLRNLRRVRIFKILRNFPKLFFDMNEKAGRLPHIFAPKRGIWSKIIKIIFQLSQFGREFLF